MRAFLNIDEIITKLLLIAFLYPGWAVLVHFAFPNEYNSLIGRSAVGVLSLIASGIYLRFKLTQNQGDLLVYSVIWVMTTHFIWVSHQAELSLVYVIGMLVYTTAVSAIFSTWRAYLLYSSYTVLGALVICWQLSSPWEDSVMLVSGLTTLGIIFTITLFVKNRLESRLQEAESTATANRQLLALGHFSGGVAHEFNNPLAVIKGNADLIQRMLDKSPVEKDRVLQAINKIQVMTMRCADIAGSMLFFSQANRSKRPVSMESESFIEDLKFQLAEKYTTLDLSRIEFDARINRFTAYPVELNRAVFELVCNGVDAQQGGTPAVRISIDTEDAETKITIANIGKELPNEVQDLMFQPFFTTSDVGEGRGLGLSVAYGISLLHHGTLNYTHEGGYNYFTFSIGLDAV